MTGRPQTSAALADNAAEAIRALNHATFPGAGGLASPVDAYDVLASLALMAARLPQLLTQLDRYLTGQVEDGRVVIDGGQFVGDPPAAAAAASCWLDRAGTAAARLAHVLDAAQQAIAYAATTNDPDGDDPDDHRCP